MAEHARTKIRRAWVALLKDANADVGEHVYTGRARPLQSGNLPAADVDFGRFGGRPDGGPIQSAEGSDATRLLQRLPILTLEVTVEHEDDYLDAIDAIYADYERVIAEDNTLGGLVARIAPIGEPIIAISAEGQLPVAKAQMAFEVEYVTAFNAPETVA